jgi:hypothetical protein
MVEWSQDCRKMETTSDSPACHLVVIVGRFIDLHASIRRGDLSDFEAIIRKALECEAQLENWEIELPLIWKPMTVTSVGAEENLYRDQYQVYRDLWRCRIWNHYRWTRILANELILTHLVKLSPLPLEYGGGYDIAVRITQKMAIEICDSVATQLFRHYMSEAPDLFIPYISGVFLLLFPLAVA